MFNYRIMFGSNYYTISDLTTMLRPKPIRTRTSSQTSDRTRTELIIEFEFGSKFEIGKI